MENPYAWDELTHFINEQLTVLEDALAMPVNALPADLTAASLAAALSAEYGISIYAVDLLAETLAAWQEGFSRGLCGYSAPAALRSALAEHSFTGLWKDAQS